MDDGLLSLKWNHHRSTFFCVLAKLREKSLYSDVTLACDGALFPTHKLVLSTCSDYFSMMLESTNCKSPIIVLKDIRKEHLTSLLSYMYLGEVQVHQNDLSPLLKAAECLQIKGLAVNDQPPPEEEVPNNHYSPSKKAKSQTDESPSSQKKRARTESNSFSNSSPNKRQNAEFSNSSETIVPTSVIKLESEDDEIKEEPPGDYWEADQGGGNDNFLENTELIDVSLDGVKYTDHIDDLPQDTLMMPEMPGPSGINDPQWTTQNYEDGTQVQQTTTTTNREPNNEHLFLQDLMTQNHPKQIPQPLISPTAQSSLNTSDIIKQYKILFLDNKKCYRCRQCDYQTMNAYSLPRHFRKHTGDKPFACPFCTHRASDKMYLVKHIRRHTGEKPYKCELCPYRAAQKSGLNYHVSTHH